MLPTGYIRNRKHSKTVKSLKNSQVHVKIEAKNSEFKHGHGYDMASSAGLFGMEIQGATTIFAVNLKRIITLLKEK